MQQSTLSLSTQNQAYRAFLGAGGGIARRGEDGARDAEKLNLESKEYLVREGRVMHLRFNA